MAAITGHIPVLLQERLPLRRTDLETFRSSLRQEVADGERELATAAAQDDDEIAHGAAADLYERELRLAEITAFKRDRYDVEAALGRMGAGTYGMCVDCGRPIPLDRLVARPQAARDVERERSVEREAAP
jgi:RNA polymerase-binding transcription factor DksA